MDVEREAVVEAAVAVLAVGLFVATVLAIGATYSDGTTFSEQGALALVGSVVLFVFLMSGIGYFLAGR